MEWFVFREDSLQLLPTLERVIDLVDTSHEGGYANRQRWLVNVYRESIAVTWLLWTLWVTVREFSRVELSAPDFEEFPLPEHVEPPPGPIDPILPPPQAPFTYGVNRKGEGNRAELPGTFPDPKHHRRGWV